MKKIIIGILLNIGLLSATITVFDNGDHSMEGSGESSSAGTDNVTSNSGTISPETETKLKAPLQNLFKSTQWNLFLREFSIKMDFGVCCKPDDILSCAIGIKAHMIEPIGYMESTHKPLYFTFADIDLGGNVLKGGMPYQVMEGNSGVRSQRIDNHFIYIPIMGMIFKKSLKFACFHKGELQIPYLSEFDPTWGMDIYYSKMIPHQIAMFTPQGLLSTIFDCVSTEIVNTLMGMQSGSTISLTAETGQSLDDSATLAGQSNPQSNFSSQTQEKMNMVRDTMYHIDGCSGYSPVGGYVDGEDPVIDLDLTFHGVQGMLHGASALSPMPFLYKQTNISIESSALPKFAPQNTVADTMCEWKDYLLPIQSQYLLQQAYPVVGEAKETGASGATRSTGKNVPGAKGVAYTVWDRRDYYAFAYFCGEDKKGDE